MVGFASLLADASAFLMAKGSVTAKQSGGSATAKKFFNFYSVSNFF